MYIFIIVAFTGMALFTDIFFVLWCAVITPMSLVISLIMFDEKDHWDLYSFTLPYSRRQLVTEKYIICLLWVIFNTVVVTAAFAVKGMIDSDFGMSESLIVPLVASMIGLVFPSFALPFVFKFGAEKGRIVYLVFMALIGGSIGFLGAFDMPPSPDVPQYLAFAIMVAASVIIFLASMFISVKIYQNKQF